LRRHALCEPRRPRRHRPRRRPRARRRAARGQALPRQGRRGDAGEPRRAPAATRRRPLERRPAARRRARLHARRRHDARGPLRNAPRFRTRARCAALVGAAGDARLRDSADERSARRRPRRNRSAPPRRARRRGDRRARAARRVPVVPAACRRRPAGNARERERGRTMIRRNGFTDEALEWRSWLRPLQLAEATPLQLEVLDESHPQSRTSPYYLTLAHQPLMLRHRSAAYNAIMYAPGGLPRAERELGALVVSVTNGCVYC